VLARVVRHADGELVARISHLAIAASFRFGRSAARLAKANVEGK
jgi:hypothetical protein